MDKKIVTELIQNDLNKENIKKELGDILYNENAKNRFKSDYTDLTFILGGKGASAKAASVISAYLNKVN
jgi:lipid-A-disaccharide synthase